MKLKYWGKDSKLVNAEFGPSPIETTNTKLRDVIAEDYHINIVIIKDEAACPNCGGINEFDVIRSFNFGIESVVCLNCDSELCTSPSPGSIQIDQDDWDTIVLSLCPA